MVAVADRRAIAQERAGGRAAETKGTGSKEDRSNRVIRTRPLVGSGDADDRRLWRRLSRDRGRQDFYLCRAADWPGHRVRAGRAGRLGLVEGARVGVGGRKRPGLVDCGKSENQPLVFGH